ncbi:MAG: hypothetical protein QOJ07_967 [Thermoleophilaceae bacterium]|jgi:hypothetical protein|nr:hypothetical protein [Thermoleophilaceae bacterium]
MELTRARVIAAAIASAGLATAIPASATATLAPAAAHNCGTIGSDQSDTGLYNVTASRLSCGKARKILKHWYYHSSRSQSYPSGWRCTTRRRGAYTFRIGCRQGSRRIAWTEYSA